MESNQSVDLINRLSDLISRLTALEYRQAGDGKAIDLIQSRLEALQIISEKLIKIDLKIESLAEVISKLEKQNWELNDTVSKVKGNVGRNAVNIAKADEEIQRIYIRLDDLCSTINVKLDSLNETLGTDYLSNASFTKLQRNVLWAVISFLVALGINLLITFLRARL